MKLRKLLVLFLVILFAIAQVTFLNNLQIFGVKPDILLILVIFFSLYYGEWFGLLAGALCGIFNEATSAMPVGAPVFIYAVAGLIMGRTGKTLYNLSMLNEICLSFIFTFVVYLFLGLTLQSFAGYPFLWSSLIYVILPVSFYTAAVAPLFFRFLKIGFNRY